MNQIKTNRDFYIALTTLIKNQRDSERSLEEYLRAILKLSYQHQTREVFPIKDFFNLLVEAFSADGIDFDPTWQENFQPDDWEIHGYEGWRLTITRQIVDLREMEEAGILDDEFCYYGVNSPRGYRWYNFDPCTFLECGTVGKFGGWRDGDETNREYVKDVSDAAKEQQEMIVDLEIVTWDDFRDFLGLGQEYE